MTNKLILVSIPIIRDLWNEGKQKQALKVYLKMLRSYGGVNGTYDLRNYSKIQVEDMELSIDHPEVLWLRSRRAGKTRDMTALSVFYTIIGYTCNWFSVTKDQLEAVRTWFELNPYTDSVTNDIVKIINCRNEINFGILSAGQVVSKGANVLFFDELRSCPIKDLKYHYYLTARGQLTASKDFKIISGTTAESGSAEQDQYNSLSSLDFEAISIHPWQDFNHLNEEFIEHERQQHLDDPWYIEQEYECKHVVRGGAVFTNIVEADQETILSFPVTHVGIDVNKSEMAVGVHVTRDFTRCYIIFEKEYNFVADQSCFDELRQSEFLYRNNKIKLVPNVFIEIENGGYNEKEAYIVSNKYNAYPMRWEDKIKGERMSIGRQMQIVMNRGLTPRLYDDLTTCIYNPTKPIYLKDNNHPNHWTDAFLHAINKNESILAISSRKQNSNIANNPFDQPQLRW